MGFKIPMSLFQFGKQHFNIFEWNDLNIAILMIFFNAVKKDPWHIHQSIWEWSSSAIPHYSQHLWEFAVLVKSAVGLGVFNAWPTCPLFPAASFQCTFHGARLKTESRSLRVKPGQLPRGVECRWKDVWERPYLLVLVLTMWIVLSLFALNINNPLR